MTARPDDDALSWGDEDDPTLHVGAPAASAEPEHAAEDAPAAEPEPTVLPDGFTAVGRGSDAVRAAEPEAAASIADTEDADDEPTLSNAALLGIGVLGGIYLLSAIGWIVGGLRLEGTAKYLVASAGYQVSFWLAVAAPVLWFVTTLWLTARSRTWVRFAWLIGGAALLLPWPFLMVGAVGR